MSEVAIRVENLGKKYRIRHAGSEPYATMRDTLARAATAPLRWALSRFRKNGTANPARTSIEDFWALKDVAFDVRQGEALGIIGRNGAGKSTLLKILSRITEPTTGRVRVRGRIASLLEVGTGFHPELTGRENIFLNGAILGMTRAEIRRKFDEIVAFAEIEQFLDTPVKRYSSGMYVRLAFAVAAHLEPEILVVDEVLAVGDAEFQKKCLGKMETVSRQEGRTILFVSHDLQAVQRLTRQSILLQQGRVAFAGATDAAVQTYLNQFKTPESSIYNVAGAPRRITGSLAATFERLWFPDRKTRFGFNEDINFRVAIRAAQDLATVCFSISICSLENTLVGTGFSKDIVSLKAGETAEFDLKLSNPRLAPGQYSCIPAICKDGWLGNIALHDVVFDVLYFEVEPPLNNDGAPASWHGDWGHSVLDDLGCRRVRSSSLSAGQSSQALEASVSRL
jgi:homopolymeric O-antigen transport system ATP-binding protein